MYSTTPLKNSKNVSKPFRSPFSTGQVKIDKRSLFDEQQSPTVKSETKSRSLLSCKVNETGCKTNNTEEKRRKIFDSEILENQKMSSCEPSKNSLIILKRKIFGKRQELESLKSSNMCAKKHNPEQLKESINKWKVACQGALEELCYELNKKNNENLKISDVLNRLGISETIVDYSIEDDSFK